MRPRTLVVGAALTASLALVALPGLAGSATPSAWSPEAAAFRELDPAAIVDAPPALGVDALAPGSRRLDVTVVAVAGDPSAGALDAHDSFSDPGRVGRVAPARRARAPQAPSTSHEEWAPAKYSLSGMATFYDNGTTAMRLPRGTIIRVCGAGGCLERVVTDYGPQSASRIIDLYRPDFFAICGCASWSGTARVTVYVY